jgi:hypothetical protein
MGVAVQIRPDAAGVSIPHRDPQSEVPVSDPYTNIAHEKISARLPSPHGIRNDDLNSLPEKIVVVKKARRMAESEGRRAKKRRPRDEIDDIFG